MIISSRLIIIILLSINCLYLSIHETSCQSLPCVDCIPEEDIVLTLTLDTSCTDQTALVNLFQFCSSNQNQTNCTSTLESCSTLFLDLPNYNASLIECIVESSSFVNLGCNTTNCNIDALITACCSGTPLVECNSTNTVDWEGNIPYNVCLWQSGFLVTEPELFVNLFDTCSSDAVILLELDSDDFNPSNSSSSSSNFQGRFYQLNQTLLESEFGKI